MKVSMFVNAFLTLNRTFEELQKVPFRPYNFLMSSGKESIDKKSGASLFLIELLSQLKHACFYVCDTLGTIQE